MRDCLSNYQSQVVGLGVIILHLNFRAIKEQEVVASTFHAKFVIERLHQEAAGVINSTIIMSLSQEVRGCTIFYYLVWFFWCALL